MKTFELKGSKRGELGKKGTKASRVNEEIPAVLYGGKEEFHFTVTPLDIRGLIYTAEVFAVELTIDGTKHKCILKDTQFHPVTDKLLHADFLELQDDKPVTVKVPVRVHGNSVGVRAGGRLVTKLRKIALRALPKDLPDSIDLNVEALEIGKHIKIADIKLDGVQVLEAPNSVITAVVSTRASQQAAAEEKGKK